MFSFLSGLYFRGKLAYGRAFASPRTAPHGVLVITPGRGLLSPETIVGHRDLLVIASVGVAPKEAQFSKPLERDSVALASVLAKDDRVVLLGSIATGKYVDIIESYFEGRLRFPGDFVGRGDMSRGGLMLRCVLDRKELEYIPIAGATRHGKKPPRLKPLR